MVHNHRPMCSSTMIMGEEERYDVFLGGSCGGRKSPTSWRKEVAIPLLQKNQVKYYNPQVDTWSTDLINKENDAKDNSDWLLFVLEMTTRGISSMVEVAYLAGLGRSIVFVLQKDRKTGKIEIADDRVSPAELQDIRGAQRTLAGLIHRHTTCKYYSVLKAGLEYVISSLKQAASSGVPVQCSSCSEAALSMHPSSVNKGPFRAFFRKILKTVAGQDRRGHLRRKRSWRPAIVSSGHVPSRPTIAPQRRFKSTSALMSSSSSGLPQQSIAAVGFVGPSALSSNNHWHPCQPNMSVVDRLLSHGVRVLQETPDVTSGATVGAGDWVARLLACSVLLIFVPADSLSTSTMCKAAYLLAQHSNSVLCVQDLMHKAIFANTELTTGALCDYNRARTYLRDMGERRGAYVCADLDEALTAACSRAAAAGHSPIG